MDNAKKSALSEFSRKAMQRLQDKKVPLRQRIDIPSLEGEATIQSLDFNEIVECLETDDSSDKKRSDKYSIYLSMVEPNLAKVAQEIMEAEAELPADQRTLREPLDVVNMFDLWEITDIAEKVMALSGAFSDKKVAVVSQLKN